MNHRFCKCSESQTLPLYHAKKSNPTSIGRNSGAQITAGRLGRGAGSYALALLLCVVLLQPGCRSVSQHRQNADKVASEIIAQKQKEAFGTTEPFGIQRPTNMLRRRLLEEQNLQYSGPWSLGTDRLAKPKHWPADDYPPDSNIVPVVNLDGPNTITLTLNEALQVGAQNSSSYQTQKEGIFQAALSLDLERDAFRNFFTEQLGSSISTDNSGSRAVSGTQQSSVSGLSRALKSGAIVSTQLAVDLANLLTMGGASSLGLQLDSSVSIPLLRGSGRHIVTEPLTLAERKVLYAIWEFERFKRTFAVNIASEYLAVLRAYDQVDNEEANYRRLIISVRRSRRLADSGGMDKIEVDQAVQNELRARNRWVLAMQSYERSLDNFKILLGLPVDAKIDLDRAELIRLDDQAAASIINPDKFVVDPCEEIPPADAPVELEQLTRDGAGRMEIDDWAEATRLAFESRLDLRVAQEKVFDAQRDVIVWADQLGAGLTLFGSASTGGRRTISSATTRDARVRLDKAAYSALLSLDLPIERVAERNDYRNSLIDLERAVRSVQNLEDQVKLNVRNGLRTLESTRESLHIQARAVQVAQERVDSTNMVLEAGRAKIRDILEAQDALVSAQNALTAAVVNYRVTELELQRDMGLLKVDAQGLWREFDPEVVPK